MITKGLLVAFSSALDQICEKQKESDFAALLEAKDQLRSLASAVKDAREHDLVREALLACRQALAHGSIANKQTALKLISEALTCRGLL